MSFDTHPGIQIIVYRNAQIGHFWGRVTLKFDSEWVSDLV